MVSLAELLDLLDSTPVIVEMHPVSRCYLPSDVAVYDTAAELAWSLDMPGTTLPVRSLILQGDPVYESGVIGDAIHLDGVDDLVVVGPVQVGPGDPRTIACWAKADTTAIGDWTNIFGFTGPASNGQHFDIEIVGATGTTTSGFIGVHRHGWEMDITANDQEWHHLAATFDGTIVSLYGDGRLANTATASNVNTPGPVHMGKRQDNDKNEPG